MESVYCEQFGTDQKCPDYKGALICRSLYMIKCHYGLLDTPGFKKLTFW